MRELVKLKDLELTNLLFPLTFSPSGRIVLSRNLFRFVSFCADLLFRQSFFYENIENDIISILDEQALGMEYKTWNTKNRYIYTNIINFSLVGAKSRGALREKKCSELRTMDFCQL
jgi:hypothetical protein